MERKFFYFKQPVAYTEMNAAFDGAENALFALAVDWGLTGIISGLAPVQNPAGADMHVQVTAGLGYDELGERIQVLTPQLVNLAVDSNSVSTAVPTSGQSRIVSVFIEFERALSDPRTDGNSATVYFEHAESFQFVVTQGVASSSTPTPPSIPSNQVLLADVTLVFGQTAIHTADISYARVTIAPTPGAPAADTTSASAHTGTYVSTTAGNVQNQLNELCDGVNTGIADAVACWDNSAVVAVHDFTASGSMTVPAGCTMLWIEACGGGGGGGGGASSVTTTNTMAYPGGGGSGAPLSIGSMVVAPGDTINVVIGVGGGGGTAGVSFGSGTGGSNGGSTTVTDATSSLAMTAVGGGGGNGGGTAAGTTGGPAFTPGGGAVGTTYSAPGGVTGVLQVTTPPICLPSGAGGWGLALVSGIQLAGQSGAPSPKFAGGAGGAAPAAPASSHYSGGSGGGGGGGPFGVGAAGGQGGAGSATNGSFGAGGSTAAANTGAGGGGAGAGGSGGSAVGSGGAGGGGGSGRVRITCITYTTNPTGPSP